MVNQSQPIRTRFAPSPTGFVHIGSLRTALFAYLFARHNHGVNILRIEDTDQNRKVEGSAENLLRVMKQLGIVFDEGFYLEQDGTVHEKGEYGPYLQSSRLDKYHKATQELLKNKKAYYCFCSSERLEEVKKEQQALKKPAMYDRHCRNMSESDVAKQLEEFKQLGKRPVVRFAIPLEGTTTIHDLIYGDITYEHKILDDQVILKSDGFPTYHLAVVVDDHFMQISHVIRGEEWIPSTPKHILIYNALGWEPTQFAHLPLILNPDKTKLSKRQGDVSVEDFLKKGYLKEALINFVAFLGWNPKTEQEIFSLEELIEHFDLSKINKSGAVFDDNKLDWFNSQYIKKLSDRELAEKLIPYFPDFLEGDEEMSALGYGPVSMEYLSAIAALEKDRLKKLSDIKNTSTYFFKAPDYTNTLLVWKKSTPTDAKEKLGELYKLYELLPDDKFTKEGIEAVTKEFIEKKGYDNGSVLWPLRAALTGLEKSPSPFEVASVLALGLGKKEVLNRIQTAINKL